MCNIIKGLAEVYKCEKSFLFHTLSDSTNVCECEDMRFLQNPFCSFANKFLVSRHFVILADSAAVYNLLAMQSKLIPLKFKGALIKV